ncbi:MAG: glycosyltransferase, partial [Pseudomonadota bacterium]
MRRILFAVTHLMGSGHLVRTMAIARAVAARGDQPIILAGGRPLATLDPAGLEIRWLPPVWVEDLDYSRLITNDGRATERFLADRQTIALDHLAAIAPDVLVTETWPFGRGSLRTEFTALTTAARAQGAKVVASIRDIPEPPGTAKKIARADAALDDIDAVLVHGDPTLIRFEEIWPLADRHRGKLQYTGYVAAPLPAVPPDRPGTGEVLVAVGQGAIGRPMLKVAAAAAGLSPHPWRLLIGGADAAEIARALTATTPAVVEPARPDYRIRLQTAACSVSLAGYNTVTEVMQSGRPALFIPMAEGGEQEQQLRARALARAGWRTLDPGALTPASLAQAVDETIAGPPPTRTVQQNGAAESARLLAAAAPP